jgi:hypothetical protein
MKKCNWHKSISDKMGYSKWFEWAEKQNKKGKEQIKCSICEYYFYPNEFAKYPNILIKTFAKKYDLGEFRFIENNVIDFTSRYTFTYEEINYALKHFLTFERLLERQEELIKKNNL